MQRQTLINQLADHIVGIQRDHPIRVGIDGFAAAGKTTLADELVEPLRQRGRQVIRVSMDHFHNPAEIRHRRGRHCPNGYYHDSFNHDAIVTCVLEPLGPGGNGSYKPAHFDYRSETHLKTDWYEAPADAILLFEGIFLQRPELASHWDLTVFVEVDFEIALERACQRDLAKFQSVDGVKQRFQQRFIPGSRLYLESQRPTQRAHIVVNNNDVRRPRLRLNPLQAAS